MTPTKKIIIIDDDAGMCRLYKTILDMENYETHAFTQAEEGLSFIATQGAPDLLLLDCAMPALSGDEFLDLMDARGLRPASYPIIGFSSFSKDTPSIVKFISRVSAYVEKPETVEQMLELVTRFLKI